MSSNRKVLLLMRSSPYGASLGRSGLDTGLAAAAFEQPVSLLFLGAGVLQLAGGQDGRAVGTRDVGRLLSSLPLYDIDSVYADADSARRLGVDLSASPITVEPLEDAVMRELLAEADVVLGF